jgi:hypothetical protein
MDTYLSAHHILRDVRESLGEYSPALLTGEDDTGANSNTWLTRRINEAQAFLYAILLKTIPDEFYAETTITGVNSVFTLPWDFGRAVQLRTDNGTIVSPILPKHRPDNNSTGSQYLYYRKGNTFVLTKSGITDTYTLYYRTKPREIHSGRAAAGGALSITLDSSFAPVIADYYNEMMIENLTDAWVDTITDYSAARVATITETATANAIYGLVSELPEPFHFLIAPRAVLQAREQSSHPKIRPGRTEYANWTDLLIETLTSYGIGEDKQSPESIWQEARATSGRAVHIPGHIGAVLDR